MTETILNNANWITLEGAFNVRDIGGYPADGGMTRPNAVFRAGSLHKLTQADQDVLLERNLRTVVDLRHASELGAAGNVFAESKVVNYHSVPLFEAQPDVTKSAAVDLATIYRYMVDSCQTGLLKALQTIANAPQGAVLIHCTAGKDRTGVVMALTLHAVCVPREVIIEDYALTTEAMNRLRPRLLGNAELTPEAAAHLEKMLGSEPALMAELLDYIDLNYGGINSYLEQIGFSSTDRDLLHTRLIQPQ
jgi:protein-tyrosine phosphatase